MKSLLKPVPLVLAALLLVSCEEEQSLYGDIPIEVISITALSHERADYQPVPDSLRLRFHKVLRILQVTVVESGCDPDAKAMVSENGDDLSIEFDMNDGCVHVRPESYDVNIRVSPVHADSIRLVVISRDFESEDPGRILMSRRVNVLELPGL